MRKFSRNVKILSVKKPGAKKKKKKAVGDSLYFTSLPRGVRNSTYARMVDSAAMTWDTAPTVTATSNAFGQVNFVDTQGLQAYSGSAYIEVAPEVVDESE